MPIERKRPEWPRFANKRDWPAFGIRHEWPALTPVPEPELEEIIRWNQIVVPGPDPEVPPTETAEPLPDPIDPISTASEHSLGPYINNDNSSAFNTVAFPAANRAFYIPFWLDNDTTIVKMGIYNGGAASGNVDIGIYDDDGTGGRPGTRLVSAGSTAQAGTLVIQSFNVTDTPLTAGYYYFGVAADNTTAQTVGWQYSSITTRALGVFQEASAFPLPATATPVAMASQFLPMVLATSDTVFI